VSEPWPHQTRGELDHYPPIGVFEDSTSFPRPFWEHWNRLNFVLALAFAAYDLTEQALSFVLGNDQGLAILEEDLFFLCA